MTVTALQEVSAKDATDARELLSEDDFRAVTEAVLSDNSEMGRESASRIVVEALKYVATAAKFPEAEMRPSALVDKGWHALILNTPVYEELCSLLGAFVHHVPDQPASASARTHVLDRTQELMAEAGHGPDLTLWLESGSAMCCNTCGPKKPSN
ncbi:hypothetical protein [Streptomyces sirii]|uniref:hypothetical protein n=1 Tax=Streptomyces sirii TaxID=3127701 RepID=UPI003D360009